MSEKITQATYLKMCEERYGDKYDHSLTKYDGMRSTITVICREHGEFRQNASAHLRWGGCPHCAVRTVADKNRYTTEKFVEKAKSIHGDKYDYSNVDYQGNKKYVIITCNECGQSFLQTPNVHLRSPNSCPYCWEKKRNAHFIRMVTKKR